MDTSQNKWVEPVYKPRWITFNFHYFNWEEVHAKFLLPLYEKLKEIPDVESVIVLRGEINKYFHGADILVKTSIYHSKQIKNIIFNDFGLVVEELRDKHAVVVRQPKHEKINIDFCIKYNEFHVIAHSKLAKLLFEEILPFSSELMMNQNTDSEEAISEAMNKFLPLFISLLYTFDFSLEEIKAYSKYHFELLKESFLAKEKYSEFLARIKENNESKKKEFQEIITLKTWK